MNGKYLRNGNGNMENTLIVIEGLDGAGKTTQIELLKNSFNNFRFITFPYYETPSGQLIKDYLSGNFNENRENVSAYTASCFYAVDRYTSFKTDWSKDWYSMKPIISARYVSSNAIYQMTKLDKNEWENYLEWLYDLEFNKFALPRQTKTIFLDVPIEISQKQLSERYNGDENKKDIHERNLSYLANCYKGAMYIAQRENWKIISCAKDGKMLSIEEISEELKKEIKGIINA